VFAVLAQVPGYDVEHFVEIVNENYLDEIRNASWDDVLHPDFLLDWQT